MYPFDKASKFIVHELLKLVRSVSGRAFCENARKAMRLPVQPRGQGMWMAGFDSGKLSAKYYVVVNAFTICHRIRSGYTDSSRMSGPK